jgi:fluoride ion exporter CrcB/FEX
MIDTIRAVFTYVTVLVVVSGGFVIIFLTRSDPSATDTRLMIAGFIGSALTFTFSTEVQTRTARQAAASTYAATSGTNGESTSSGPSTASR